ncbi:alkyl/aryl-sulfatase [Actinoplanes aureus]|uniref:Linear primary-alkylsulfatase n=1 Tax=Actinoplanes aureus TaxID=2792083 RepID=A0A931C8Y8_9ACTN|nr:alkyl sulfatase dimerization domain-containing protein [Actinoplanes aureus]MBG0564349.1 MBL fold metallo-hydrolase [Actinoplanes aureus]
MANPASRTIEAQHEYLAKALPFHDRRDFEDARRGFVAALDQALVKTAEGRVVWDSDPYAFLTGEAPATVNPSLWRQSLLTSIHGLFEVVPGIYQVRGLDLSNITFVEGERGVLVIDPLVSSETAAAALALYREHRGDRPVTGMVYTHSHVDHFGGARGILPGDQAGGVPVLAPAGFARHAVNENVYAGTAMSRRAAYMYGAVLPRGPQGQVGAGLGQTNSTGTVTLIPPTVDIGHTGQEETVDGIRMVFQMAPGSEAPAEMHLYFPDHRALCMAENATHNLHNLLTLRGAEVRDPHAWAGYLSEAAELYGGDLEVLFASHHWPTWGRERAVEFLLLQRDLYAYLHDQTVRMINVGMTGPEIAEAIQLPPALEQAWHARGYYGSVSHNVKAIYQRYLGWYDGNPAHLWPHPPAEAARRYVDFMGGADSVVTKARATVDAGDFRWAAEVLNHVIFAEPGHGAARELLADTYEQLGYGSENGTWRCVYLSAAHELRHGSFGTPATTSSADMIAQLTPEQLFAAMAIRVNGPRCWDDEVHVDIQLTDIGRKYRLSLRNGVLTHTAAPQPDLADATVTLPSAVLPLAVTVADPAELAAAGVTVEGNTAVFGRLLAALDEPDPDFAIVTP